jgi:glycosyltransferase involved in cell wall biosynthesis
MLYFLIPVYNEEGNLEKLHESITSVAKEYPKFYVFSDDGSKDGSIPLIDKLFKGENYKVLSDGANHGPGMAFNMGFEWILSHSKAPNDKIITIEADNTSDINILPNMITMSNLGYDLVLASIYAQGGGFDKTSFFRKFISSVAAIIMRYGFDIKVLTISSFYRVYGVGTLRKIKEKYTHIIEEKGFISVVELLIKAIKVNATIIEVPMVLYSKKRQGKSKMKIMKTSLDYIKFLLKSKAKL